MQTYEPHKSSIGDIDANILAMLCYIVSFVLSIIPIISYIGWLAPLVIYLIEKKSPLVRYHAMQSFILVIICSVIRWVLAAISYGLVVSMFFSAAGFGTFLGTLISVLIILIDLVCLVFCIISAIKSYQWNAYSIPLVGKLTDQIVKPIS